MTTKEQVGIGAGAVAIAAAAAAGYYFYASTGARKHRKIAASWAGALKRDVVREARKMMHIDRARIASAIDAAAAAYESVRTIDGKQLVRATKELKDNWQKIVAEAGVSGAQSARKRTKRATKKGSRPHKKVIIHIS